MKQKLLIIFLTVIILIGLGAILNAQSKEDESAELKYMKQQFESLNHRLSQLGKAVDDIM